MKIVEKYIGQSIILSSLVILASLLGIFSFFSFIESLSDHSTTGPLLLFAMTLFDLPGLAFNLMPIAVLVGTLLALGGFMEKNELIVVRMAGGEKLFIFGVVFKSATVLVILSIFLGEVLAPVSQNISTTKSSSMSNFRATNDRVWTKEDNAFISVGSMSSDCHLSDIKILKFGNDGALTESISAKNGACIKDGWELSEVEKTFFERDAKTSEKANSLIWKTDLDSNLFEMLGSDPQKLGLIDLWAYEKYAERNAQHSQRWAQAFWSRLIYPFTTYFMVLLAFPLALMSSRSTTVGRVIFIGVCVGLTFYVLNRLSSSFGIAFDLNPVLASLSPSLLMLAIGTWLNIRVH